MTEAELRGQTRKNLLAIARGIGLDVRDDYRKPWLVEAIKDTCGEDGVAWRLLDQHIED